MAARGSWMGVRLSAESLGTVRHNLRFSREDEGAAAGILAWVCAYEAVGYNGNWH